MLQRLLARLGIVCPYCYGRRWTGWVLGGVDFEARRPGQHFRICRHCGEEQWRSFFRPPRNRMPDEAYERNWSHEHREQRRHEFDAATWGEFQQ
jgi:hypothetical protein